MKIILKDVEDITDEDYIELFEMLYMGNEDISKNLKINLIRTHINDLSSMTKNWKTILVIDFLRMKGYMIPYLGVDLFEKNLAIRDDFKNTNSVAE